MPKSLWVLTVRQIALSALVVLLLPSIAAAQAGVTTGVTDAMRGYGLPAPEGFAFVASTLELVGGILLLIGLFGRWLGLLYTIEFIVAFFYVKLRLQTFADGRLDLMLLAGAILLFLAGPGRAAVDEAWLEKG